MIRHTIKPQSSIRRNPLCVSWCSSAVPPQRALRNHTGPPRVRAAACRKPPTYQSAPSASGRNQPQLNVSAQEQQIHWDGAPANSLSKRVPTFRSPTSCQYLWADLLGGAAVTMPASDRGRRALSLVAACRYMVSQRLQALFQLCYLDLGTLASPLSQAW